jgi:hypothetical protein
VGIILQTSTTQVSICCGQRKDSNGSIRKHENNSGTILIASSEGLRKTRSKGTRRKNKGRG